MLYVNADGTGVPMLREELEGRPGRQPDGSSKTREVKLGGVFTQQGCDEEGWPLRDPESIGAAWLWELARVNFPGAVEILDLPCVGTLEPTLKLLVKDDPQQAKAQRQRWLDFIKAAAIEQVLAEARLQLPRRGPARSEAQKQIAYFEKNRVRMRYATFRAEYFIGSGRSSRQAAGFLTK